MALVSITLNGNKIQADDSQTILELSKANNINIPTLCHDPRIAPNTSCFICVVDVKGAKSLVPSCATKLRDGMEIDTHSDRVISARKTALELLLSNHYGDCLAPCKLTCPAGLDIQGYVGLIARGEYDEALKLIKDYIPFPASVGRVCPRFCEEKCRRQYVDESISINFLKRFVADIDLAKDEPYLPNIASSLGKKVAIIGGGPAGLSAAYYLIQNGIEVEIFEAKEKLGGMLYYGIPEYRLPKEVVAKEIETITKLGTKIHFNKIFGKDISFKSLKNDKFNSILLSMGAWKAGLMNIPGENSNNVFDGIRFLEQVIEKNNPKISGRVAIIGGGNTAFDCARTSLRLGAKEVIIIYRRTRVEMPANEIEIIEAEEEGIKFHFLTAPSKILVKNNSLELECIKMRLGNPDISGRQKPEPIDNSHFIENFDFIISAIGQSPDYSMLHEESNKLLNELKYLKYDKNTYQTNIEYIFAAGDYAIGAATVVEAIASGKKAALSILKFLKNEPIILKDEFISKRENLSDFTPDFFDKWPKVKRQNPDSLIADYRKTNFEEIEDVFTEDQALVESNRCIECGCLDVYQCLLKKYSEEYKAKDDIYKGALNTPINDNSHPYIFREPEKCILCGRCLALCRDKINIGVYGFVGRGLSTLVAPSFNDPLIQSDCISCGTCISGCPVGALVSKSPNNKSIPLKGNKIDSFCCQCSITCNNTYETLTNSIVEIHERSDYLCEKGKFRYPSKPLFLAEQPNYSVLKEIQNAYVYPSPSLSNEDYEYLKLAAFKQNWKIINYYSQSTLWQSFSSVQTLPSMNFFNKSLAGNTLVVLAGNIEDSNPIIINILNNILQKDTSVLLINKKISKRLDKLGAQLVPSLSKFQNEDIKIYNEIILLINPVEFDKIYTVNSSLSLYNHLVKNNQNVQTTLFSNHHNLYSFYDSKNIISDKLNFHIFIGIKPNVKNNFIYLDSLEDENILPIGHIFQTGGTFLNSKNEYNFLNQVLKNNVPSLSEILIKLFDLPYPIKTLNFNNLKHEIQLNG